MACRRFRKSYNNRNRKRRVNSKNRKFKRRTRAEFNKRFILNLSKRKLSQDEILLLSKGTKFVPTPSTFSIRKQILMDYSELMRKMRCRFHYSKISEDKEIHPLYFQTGHIPPKGNNALENYLTDTLLEISSLEVKQFRDNLSPDERTALKNFMKNSEIHIS